LSCNQQHEVSLLGILQLYCDDDDDDDNDDDDDDDDDDDGAGNRCSTACNSTTCQECTEMSVILSLTFL